MLKVHCTQVISLSALFTFVWSLAWLTFSNTFLLLKNITNSFTFVASSQKYWRLWAGSIYKHYICSIYILFTHFKSICATKNLLRVNIFKIVDISQIYTYKILKAHVIILLPCLLLLHTFLRASPWLDYSSLVCSSVVWFDLFAMIPNAHNINNAIHSYFSYHKNWRYKSTNRLFYIFPTVQTK